MSVDKNQAMLQYMCNCPQIAESPLYFNFVNAKAEDKQFVTNTSDKRINRGFIDGSVLKRYSFTIMDYRSVAYQAVVKQEGYPNENVEEVLDIQGIIDWIDEQNDNRNFPDFGEDCQIDEIRTTSENPNLNSVNTQVSPALAKYSVTIQVDYIDTSKKIFS